METLGEILKALRSKKGWSQEHVAHELDMSLPGYSKIERAKSDVSLTRLSQIARLYNLSIIELLSYGNNSQSCKELLDQRDQEIIKLQRKIIELMDK